MSEDFGLLYESTFTGSMFGTSPVVFAVWAYVVAKGYGGQVDLNPRHLAATFGTTVADVEAAIRIHCAPDPESRSDAHEGRRLLPLGGTRYDIVNHELYKSARTLEERKAYNRAKKREERERKRSTTEVPIFDMSKSETTTADPLVSVSVSSPSGSDREGVQGELHTKLGDWVVPPELYDEAERVHGISRETLDFRVDKLRNRKIPGEGRYDRTAYVRGLLSEWASWEDPPTAKRKRASSPAAALGPPWVDDWALVFAREHGMKLAAEAREFDAKHHPPPRCLPVAEARRAFHEHLAARAAPGVVAA